MTMSVGYARCSTSAQDLEAQRRALLKLGVPEARIYVDHGLTGANRDRPGLREALAAVRAGDTLVVPKLDRLARSVVDARQIGDDLAERGVKLSIGGAIHDPADPIGKMFFGMLALFAEFELDLIRMRTREGMAVAKSKGRLKGRRPTLTRQQDTHIREMREGGKPVIEIAEVMGVSRQVVYRSLERTEPQPAA